MSQIFTSCNGCKFACHTMLYDPTVKRDGDSKFNKQTECGAGRLQKYHDLGITVFNEENRHYDIIGRFCNMLRPPTFEGTVSLARKEIGAVFSFVLVFNRDLDKLTHRIREILEQRGENHRIRSIVVVNEWVEYQEEIRAILEKYLNPKFKGEIPYFLVLDLLSKSYENKLDDGFDHCKNGFVYMGDCETPILPDMCDSVDKIVNDDLRQILASVPHNNCFIVNSGIYKILNGSRHCVIGGELDTKNFFERLSGHPCDVLDETFWEDLEKGAKNGE